MVELPADPEERAALFRNQAVVAFKLASEFCHAEHRAILVVMASEWLRLASQLDGLCGKNRL